jgi:hypothetical protein
VSIATSCCRSLLLATALAAVPLHDVLALEKAAPCPWLVRPGFAQWDSFATCEIVYYNVCTGWSMGWQPCGNNRLGVNFQACQDGCRLESSAMYMWAGSPPGYGFTGTVDVFAADANACPTGPVLASTPFLPVGGWNKQVWGAVTVPSSFVIRATVGNAGYTNPALFALDLPQSGAGVCYPANRTVHSYYYGTVASPLCPGSPFYDAVGAAELAWVAGLSACPTSLESASWGRVKTLYR